MTLPRLTIPGDTAPPITSTRIVMNVDTLRPRLDLAQAIVHIRCVDEWTRRAPIDGHTQAELHSLLRRARTALTDAYNHMEVS